MPSSSRGRGKRLDTLDRICFAQPTIGTPGQNRWSVEPQSLAALAFVNSECRQLARSSQFAYVCFELSRRSIDLLHRLRDECETRSTSTTSQLITYDVETTWPSSLRIVFQLKTQTSRHLCHALHQRRRWRRPKHHESNDFSRKPVSSQEVMS